MSNDIKVLRGQVRQVVREMLTEEMAKAIEASLLTHIDARLDKIEQKQKDILGFTVRNTTLGIK
jgi:hypothetical protein